MNSSRGPSEIGPGGVTAIGVTGTVVEDTIVTADGRRTEAMGGIYYAVLTLRALLPSGTELYPILAVGNDAVERVRRDLRSLPGTPLEGIQPVPETNNKVHIVYATDGSRKETLTGGVSPLGWEALETWIPRLDVWSWNLVSGYEIERSTFERLKGAFGGPIHFDIHSLCLGPSGDGPRRPRRPQNWEGWVEGTTWVQMNQAEAGLLGTARSEPLAADEERALAARIHRLGVGSVLVTRGRHGATLYEDGSEPVHESGADTDEVDPTGCGDVFGGAWVALRAGRGFSATAALRGAVRVAGIAATFRGTAGLHERLVSITIDRRATGRRGRPEPAR